jgi:hypothetical protein
MKMLKKIYRPNFSFPFEEEKDNGKFFKLEMSNNFLNH